MFKNRRNVLIVAGISVTVLLAAVLIIANIQNQNASAASYQTTTVQRGTLTVNIEGSGTVKSQLSATLNWQESGQVEQVNVQIGDQVKAGDVLAVLRRPADVQANLENALINAQQNLAELTSPSAIAAAQATVATDEQNLANARAKLASLTSPNQSAIDNAHASLVLAESNLQKAKDAYDALSALPDSDVRKAQAYQALYSAQQKYNSAQYTYTSLMGQASKTTIEAAKAAVAQAEAKLAEDKAYLAALTGGEIPEDATGSQLLKLKQAKLAVQTAQENLKAPQIIAPFDGTITQINVVPNAVVSQGTWAFRIDNFSALVVTVQVVEIDINKVKVDQPAIITFDAIPGKTYHGKVLWVDMSGTTGQNSINFNATIQVIDADLEVKPGMSANATITTNQVENALLVPTTSIFVDDNGQQYVYLIQNGTPEPVAVTVGISSDTMSQITSDNLHEGDVIVLSFASTTTASSSRGFGFGGFGVPGDAPRNP